MINKIKRVTSIVLCFLLISMIMPYELIAEAIVSVDTSTTPYESISNGYLSVKVSNKNGGFLIDTVEGDRLEKSDDNKYLLYPDADYDTSFTTFRVNEEGEIKDYIFGRDYGSLQENGELVNVENVSINEIKSTWSVDGIIFIQTLNLVGSSSAKHGFVNISYQIETTKDVTVSARILMDTALGYNDAVTYQLANKDGGVATMVENEQLLDNTNYAAYKDMFYAYDNPLAPSITAYVLDGIQKSTGDVESSEISPSQVAFGHWANMASTEYSFEPDEELYFANPYNEEHLIADSAFALYFDLGELKQGEQTVFSTNYGMFSNINESINSELIMNVLTENITMELNDAKDGFIEPEFTVATMNKNVSDNDLENVLVTVVAEEGISVLDSGEYRETTALNPYSEMLASSITSSLLSNGQKGMSFEFKTEPTESSGFKKIQIRTYKMNSHEVDATPILSDMLSSEDLYVYCPAGNIVDSPEEQEVTFYKSSPNVVYSSGTRNITIYGENFYLLEDISRYNIMLESTTDTDISCRVPRSNIAVDDENNAIVLVLDEEMITDKYKIVLEYTDITKGELTSNALVFNVSDKGEYKVESVGIVTVEKTGDNNYEIKSYTDSQINSDPSIKDKLDNYDDVILKFTGDLSITRNGDTIERVEGVSVKKVDEESSNTVRINDCIVAEDGSVIITDEDGVITTNIDANVKTESSITVWDGVCAITAIEDGKEYNLNTFDIHGEEGMNSGEIIRLIWPGAAGGVQKIAGFLFNLRYCEFGLLKEDDNISPVASFGAQMDLSFLIPSNLDRGSLSTTPLERAQLKLGISNYTATELRKLNDDYANDKSLMDNAESGTGAIYVNNVLFGKDGFYGFNADLNVGIPSYSSSFPAIEGTLHIAIVGVEYAFGVDGTAEIFDMGFTVEISFKSKNSIPVPDTLYFALYGFIPGVPVDPFGIIWVQGLGGGVSNMYDTFFGGSLIPPAVISMTGGVGIFSVLSGTGNVDFGARGIALSATDINVEKIKVLDKAGISADWYPSIDLRGEMILNIADIIYGTAYLAYIQEKEDVEIYGKGGIKIPDYIPIVKGKEIAGVSLGMNTEKVWAGVEILKIDLGVIYYWEAGKVEVGKDVDIKPNLVMSEGVSVAYDAENNRTLMMVMDNTMKLKATSSIGDFAGNEYVTASNDPDYFVLTNTEQQVHQMNLGSYMDATDALSVTYQAVSIAQAEQFAKEIEVTMSNGDDYELNWYINPDVSQGLDGGLTEAEQVANENANASLYYDEETGDCDVSISFSDESSFNQNIAIIIPVSSQLALYSFENMPKITELNYNANEGTVSWNGEMVDSYKNIEIYAENLTDGTIYQIASSNETESSTTVEFPETAMTTGEYQIKMMAFGDDDDNFYSEVIARKSDDSIYYFDYTNSNQPDTPSGITASPNGDYTIKLSNLPITDVPDGYIVNIYNMDGVLTEYANVAHENTEDSLDSIIVGGQYVYKPEDGDEITHGLTAGNYDVGVSAYKLVSTGTGDEEREVMFVSDENKVNVDVPDPIEVTFDSSFSPSSEYLANKNITQIDDETGESIKILTMNESDIKANITASHPIDGTWELDESIIAVDAGTMKTGIYDGSTEIELSDLEDGVHTLTVSGRSETGDFVRHTVVFAIDTKAPVLQLYSPITGGQFDENGTLTVRGLLETGSTLCVEVNGKLKTYLIEEQDFTQVVSGLESVAMEEVTIYARDEVGNESPHKTFNLLNSGLTSVIIGEDGYPEAESYLAIFKNGIDVTDTVISKYVNVTSHSLTPKVVSAQGNIIELNEIDVEYEINVVVGSAEISEDGNLEYEVGTIGTISVSLFDGVMIGMVGLNEVSQIYVSKDNNSANNNSVAKIIDDNIFATEKLQSGEYKAVEIPSDILADSSFVVVFYEEDGEQIILPLSKIVDGKVEFIAPVDGTYYLMVNRVTFTDCENHWAIEYINELAAKEVTSGINDSEFGPDMTLSRAMVVTLLHRINMCETPISVAEFSDVSKDVWYSEALNWAVENNVVMGYTNDIFAPDDAVTREQIVSILYRSIEATTGEEIPDIYTDREDVSPWALEAMEWAIENGIVSGDDQNLLRPQGICTRAEAMTLFVKFIQLL